MTIADLQQTPVLAPNAKRHRDDPKRIEDAAAQFEALLLTQMLRSAREAGGTDQTSGGEAGANSPLSELAEEQFAQALARQGGLGIAKMVMAGLKTHANR